jgi:glycerol-3-phosphate acyltransferase PlsY
VPITYYFFLLPKTGKPQILYLLVLATALVFITHRSNIKRLLAGEERRIGASSR